MTAINPTRLNHAVLYVSDLDRAVDFYTTVFGMDIVEREPRMNAAFLRLPRGTNHHDLGLFGVGPVQPPQGRRTGLYHLAWQVNTVNELAAARTALLEADAYTGESSHGATLSVYGKDAPDGNEFEIMWMLPRDAWGEYETRSVVEYLDLDAELARWTGVSTA